MDVVMKGRIEWEKEVLFGLGGEDGVIGGHHKRGAVRKGKINKAGDVLAKKGLGCGNSMENMVGCGRGLALRNSRRVLIDEALDGGGSGEWGSDGWWTSPWTSSP